MGHPHAARIVHARRAVVVRGFLLDALVDELVDQSMNTDGSDLDLGPDGPDDIHDAPAPGTDTARPDASSPRDDRPPTTTI